MLLFLSVWSQFSSLSRVRLFATTWTAVRQASLSITNSWSLLKLLSNESVMPSNHLILCHPLLLQPSIFPSIRVFSNESLLHIRWPKYWSFSFSISPSNEYSGLISFRMDWLDLLVVQGTLKIMYLLKFYPVWFCWKLKLNLLLYHYFQLSHFCSVAKSCLTLWDPMDCSMPGFPVLHSLLELADTHVHWVSDAIQPSHPLLPLLLLSIFPSIRVFSNEKLWFFQ